VFILCWKTCVVEQKLFEPPLLEEPVTITHPVKNISDFQLPLANDTQVDTQTHSTRHRAYTLYLVASQGQTPTQAKWITTEVLHNKFPHLLMEVVTLPFLNREELGQGGHLCECPPRVHFIFQANNRAHQPGVCALAGFLIVGMKQVHPPLWLHCVSPFDRHDSH
jgi:hypothetical protein